MTRFLPAVTIAALLLIAASASAQIVPNKESLSNLYTGKAYSPYAHRTFPRRPLWGDSHLHTALSMNAGLFGNRLPPRDAYRLAIENKLGTNPSLPGKNPRVGSSLVCAGAESTASVVS